MNQIAILCLEDEPEVREAVLRDLREFESSFRIESAEDAEDAHDVIRSLTAEGDRLGLILCDHRLPGTSGVEFLANLHADPAHRLVRKVLLTGQAGQQDTIRAINEAGLHHYIAKPWQADLLTAVVREQLTSFVLTSGLDPMPFLGILDAPRLLAALRKSGRNE